MFFSVKTLQIIVSTKVLKLEIDTPHKDTQHTNKKCGTQHNIYADLGVLYAECTIHFIPF